MLAWVGDIGVAAAIQFALGVCGTGSSFFVVVKLKQRFHARLASGKTLPRPSLRYHLLAKNYIDMS